MIQLSIDKGSLEAGKLKAVKFLNDWNAEKMSAINQVVHDSGFIMEAEIKSSIAGQRDELRSVDTGQFLQSITTDNSTLLLTKVYTNIPYARFLEEGTVNMRARRHFTNSLERKGPEVKQNIQRILNT